MKAVTILEAKTTLSKLIAEVESGRVREVVISRGKKEVARLVPTRSVKRKFGFGSMKGKIKVGPEFFEPLSDEELKAWGL